MDSEQIMIYSGVESGGSKSIDRLYYNRNSGQYMEKENNHYNHISGRRKKWRYRENNTNIRGPEGKVGKKDDLTVKTVETHDKDITNKNDSNTFFEHGRYINTRER